MGRKHCRSVRAIVVGVVGSVLSFGSATALAGPYTEAGVPASSSSIVGWATGATIARGPLDIANPTGGSATFGAAADALGPASGAVPGEGATTVVSLGDGGSATLTFASPIVNGPGADFAVFENAFLAGSNVFAEFGFVEVSANGTDFFRFDAVSLTQTATQVSSFGTIDPTNVYNLAGKHVTSFGTPFDLQELLGRSPLLNVNAVTAVRVVDVIGTIGTGGTFDSLGNKVNDPYPTAFASGGFDLDAVGVINSVPEPSVTALAAIVAMGLLLRLRIRPNVRPLMVTAGILATTLLALSNSGAASASAVATFDDNVLTGIDHHDNSAFTSGGLVFSNVYDPTYGSWSGFAYSKVQDDTTAGFGNQYAAYAGSAASGVNYGLAYYSAYNAPAYINLPPGERAASVKLTNTTYAALSMKNGDPFAKKFGGTSGNDPDFLAVTFTGYEGLGLGGEQTGHVTFYLADFRSEQNGFDYIVKYWTTVDLSALNQTGDALSIGFSMSSSDVGQFGINTPTYFALDDLVTVPEPVGIAFVALGAGLLAGRRRPIEVRES
jgi:hypothetical protein